MLYEGVFRYTRIQERARIVWMWAYKIPARTIAREIGMSVSSVYKWIQRWRQEGTVNTRPRSRRPRLSSLKDRKSINDATKNRNCNMAVQEDPSHLLTSNDQECLLQHSGSYSAFKRYQVCGAERSRSLELCRDWWLWHNYMALQYKRIQSYLCLC